MNQTLTMGLLLQPKLNYRSFCIALALHGMAIAGLVHVGLIKPDRVLAVTKSMVYTPLVLPETAPVRPQPRIKAYEPPVVARLVIPKFTPVIRPAVVEPPKLEIETKAPVLTNAPVPTLKLAPQVQVGAFTPTKEKPTLPKPLPAEHVQTGGFGDPNGVKGQGDGKSQLTISSLGSFDMPNGPGYGNGTGGARGKAGIVSSSGFDPKPEATVSSAIVHAPVHDIGKPVEILSHDRPDYTEEGRKLGIQGEVLLRVRFGASGQVCVLDVVQGLGHGLDEQAERAAEKIKFKPAESNGQRVDSVAVVHVIFELAS
jgi:TonB family protein